MDGQFEEDTSSEEEENEIVLGSQKRVPYYNKEVMELKLSEITSKLDWIHRLDIVTDCAKLKIGGDGEKSKTAPPGAASDIQDDFKREMMFYCQAQASAKEALAKLHNLGVATERPEDYFAEMVKSDIHMQKVREKLISRKDNMEKSEKAKKQRQLKKIGKKIQQDVMKKRQQDKKKMLDNVNKIKKGRNKLERENEDDIFNVSAANKKKERSENKGGVKRKHKDEKFGFGGKKRKVKKNTKESSQEMSSFKPRIHANKNSQKFGNKNKSGKPKRLGKLRRAQSGGKRK